MMTIVESAANRSREAHEAVVAEMREARAAGRRLGVAVVERGPGGEWRAAARWQGSRAQTEAADRRLRLQFEARSLPAPTGLDHDRARRLRVAEAEASVNPLGRRAPGRPVPGFWLGIRAGAPR